jgi:hypothetical protein
MDNKSRILLSATGAAVAAGVAYELKRRHNRVHATADGTVCIGRSRSDNPIVSSDEVDLYDSTPLTFVTDPAEPELDWVVTITDRKGTPFAHSNGKPQAIFTPANNVSQSTVKRPTPGKTDVYKYKISLPQYGTELDPKIIVH